MIQQLGFVARRRFRGVRADSALVVLEFGGFININATAIFELLNTNYENYLGSTIELTEKFRYVSRLESSSSKFIGKSRYFVRELHIPPGGLVKV